MFPVRTSRWRCSHAVGRPAGALPAAAAAARCGRCCLSSSFSAAGCAIASCRLRANRRRRSDQSTGDLVKIAKLSVLLDSTEKEFLVERLTTGQFNVIWKNEQLCARAVTRTNKFFFFLFFVIFTTTGRECIASWASLYSRLLLIGCKRKATSPSFLIVNVRVNLESSVGRSCLLCFYQTDRTRIKKKEKKKKRKRREKLFCFSIV